MSPRACLAAACLLVAAAAGSADDVPNRGLLFERWVRDAFFGGYRPSSPTDRWDVLATENRDHGGVPANIRVAPFGGTIELGDALRQYEIDEPFILLVAFWQPEGGNARIVSLAAPLVRSETWRRLWGPVSYADLLRFAALIKDPARPVDEIRRLALKMRSEPPFSESAFQLLPRLDANGQRQLRCCLRVEDFFARVAPEASRTPQPHPTLWGTACPASVAVQPRERD